MRRGLWSERKVVSELARKKKWFEQSSGVRSGVYVRDAQIGLGRLAGEGGNARYASGWRKLRVGRALLIL